ncbi:hypothetical protein C1I97_23070 [Streptomyces sp. NTH33]|uniref:DUF2752 domain-containing protein n=1 Tax=Streptomyces sp. NTH33 TaxID=1735453 RepID=UPI000DA90C33|nr:DUF2752 domain-containing protein [Streptomyces sp. NTH33]PZH00635.1 hypothetical protein C1I97_23070 [Streptomyces sp. NTH33]
MQGVNADSQRVTHGRTPIPRPRHTQDEPAVPTHATAVLGRLAVPAGVLTAVAGAFVYVGAVDPNEPGHYPVCPLLRYAGVYCPGCGGLRSAHALVHGDVPAALQNNALAVTGFLAFAVLWTLWAVRAARGRPSRIAPGPVHLWSLGVLLVAFTVVRNLPFGGWLHP